jgi:hypothetical protein
MDHARNAMKPLSWLCLLLLVVTLAGCAPSLPRDHAERLIAVRDALLDYPEGEIPSSNWPQAVAELKPKRVYRNDEGLYIITYEFFVEQRGVFILDPASSFIPSELQDPSYDVVIAGVFFYRSAG